MSDSFLILNRVGVEGSTVYLMGSFSGSVDFDQNATVSSRGDFDGFIARYDSNDGHLTAVQRVGGSGYDSLSNLAVADGWLLASGKASPPDADFLASEPGQMSAFVPVSTKEVFTMRLNVAAPIVHVADTDISVAPGTPVTLSATTSAGTITWYESGQVVGTGNELPITLGLGTHQISAIATGDAGRIGMAGVVVTVAPATLAINMAAFGEQTGGQTVTLDQADRLLSVAVALWSTGSHAAVPALLTVELDDLPSGQLGAAFGHTITLDVDANGAGWHADRATLSAGRVDLLAVLAHEVGHLLGYDHSDLAGDLMAATLPAGTRRLPNLRPMVSSPLALPETRLNLSHSDLVDQTLLTSEVDRDTGADIDPGLLPLLPMDDVDRPQISSEGVQAWILRTIDDDDEAELLDEELLDLIAAEQK